MSEDSTRDIFGSGRRARGRKLGKLSFHLLQALDREAKVIQALPHAHIGMVAGPPYHKIYRAIGYAQCILIAKIFARFEPENLLVELGDRLGLESSDRYVVYLPWLLPAVFLVAFLNFRMFFPRDVELRSCRVMAPKYRKGHLLQPLGHQGFWIFLLHFF